MEKYIKVETKNEMINDFNNTWNYPYWVELLQKYLTDRLKIEYLAYEWYYENDVELSYKRCYTRSYSINVNRINSLRKYIESTLQI